VTKSLGLSVGVSTNLGAFRIRVNEVTEMSLSPSPGGKMVAPAIAFLARHISVGPRVPVHAGIEIIVNRGYEIRNPTPPEHVP